MGGHLQLTFSQTSGQITDESGDLVAVGWAGHGEGKSNPVMQGVVCTGPLPQGTYMVGRWHDQPHLGPMVAALSQVKGETYGRSGFYIHGPSSHPENYGQESQGCIVVPHDGRQRIHDLNPSSIVVVP